MKHYKNLNGQIFGFDDDQLHLVTPDMVEITLAEVQELNKPTPEQLTQARIAELKQLLASTDYKVAPDYDKPDEHIIAQRQAWRDEIRELENA